jgi:inhibitor of KinA
VPKVIEPLGDQGALARLSDEGAALRWAEAVRKLDPPWLLDVVQAYSTVAVFHDPSRITAREALRLLSAVEAADTRSSSSLLHLIPCCYTLGPDLQAAASLLGLSPEEVIRLHSGTEYAIHAIGFCPGFPYLGYLPPPLCGLPRLPSPRLRVEAGSVGLTGRQTGIYTELRPGGWMILGRTPLTLVDVPSGYFPLRVGGRVRFQPISEDEYARLLGQRLGGSGD